MPIPAAATAAKFPTTQWTVVLSLKDADGSMARAKAMRELCQAYWFPLYAFARHRSLPRPDAEDAVQSFFASTGDADFFQKAEQHKGKLRTFILTAFTRMLLDHRDRSLAQKRGGGAHHLSIDADQAEAWLLADPKSTEEDATLAFERHWAKNIIRSVLADLEAEAELTPKSASRFQIVSRFLMPESCLDYTIRQAAADLDINVATCEKAIQRLRARFRQAVRKEVACTLNHPTEASITEEMIQLQKALIE
jgi:DNA-directed RNA polymerase specialized sigma24 family protein